jgi:hypothetical protein
MTAKEILIELKKFDKFSGLTDYQIKKKIGEQNKTGKLALVSDLREELKTLSSKKISKPSKITSKTKKPLPKPPVKIKKPLPKPPAKTVKSDKSTSPSKLTGPKLLLELKKYDIYAGKSDSVIKKMIGNGKPALVGELRIKLRSLRSTKSETLYIKREIILPTDIMKLIMETSDIKALESICLSAKGAEKLLCQDTEFWKRKFMLDKKPLPNIVKLYPKTLNGWVELYRASDMVDKWIKLIDQKPKKGEEYNPYKYYFWFSKADGLKIIKTKIFDAEFSGFGFKSQKFADNDPVKYGMKIGIIKHEQTQDYKISNVYENAFLTKEELKGFLLKIYNIFPKEKLLFNGTEKFRRVK